MVKCFINVKKFRLTCDFLQYFQRVIFLGDKYAWQMLFAAEK